MIMSAEEYLVNFFCVKTSEKLFGVPVLLRLLNISSRKLGCLFESGKLKAEDFTTLDGQIIYKYSDLAIIREALYGDRRKNYMVFISIFN